MTIKDVAEYFNVSRRTIYRWLEKGVIPAYKVNDQYRFVLNEIVDWATANRVNESSLTHISNIKKQKPKYPLYAATQSGGIYYRIEGDNIEKVFSSTLNLLKLPPAVNKQLLYESLIEREKISSTGIGNGLALPEIKNPNDVSMINTMLNICFLEDPIEFSSLDGVPVKCLVLLFCPDYEMNISMKSRLHFILKNPELTKQINLCGSRDDILQSIKAAESELINENKDFNVAGL